MDCTIDGSSTIQNNVIEKLGILEKFPEEDMNNLQSNL
jgi:hypothetical protein